jgi:hypothetical protein
MPLADNSQNTRAKKLRGRVLASFHAANPLRQINGPRGITPSSVLTERYLYTGVIDIPYIYQSRIVIINENKTTSGSISGLTQINFTGIYDAGYGSQAPIPGVLDDAIIPIPMGGMIFNFFGTNYSNDINWNSNNALLFGSTFNPSVVSISATNAKSILIGNYDRLCTGVYYSNTVTDIYSITTLIVTFTNYFTDTPPVSPTYKYQIRLIKENIDTQRQFVEVCIVSSPPSPGYSTAAITYPSGSDINGNPIDSNATIIDQTKVSPYNITNGSTFLNPCGTVFSTSSPLAGTSFVFSSDSSGSNWTFSNNSYVNV